MTELYFRLVVLALGSSMSANLLGTTALLLQTSRPVPMLVAYGAGGYLLSTALGVVIQATAADFLHRLDARLHLSPAVDFGVGVLLVGFAALRVVRRARGKLRAGGGPVRRWIERRLEHPRVWVAFVIGLATSLPGATYVLALKEIATSGKPLWQGVVLIALFNVVAFWTVWVPVLLLIFRPEEARPTLRRAQAWLEIHTPAIVTGGAGALGLYLATVGAYRLWFA
jgi:hypothetical protein